MSAMRLYSKEQLEETLIKLGWQDTGEKSATASYWQNSSGKKITVPPPDPLSDSYSDFVYDGILLSAIKLSDPTNTK